MTVRDFDDDLLDALGQVFRDQEAEAEALWPAEAPLHPLDEGEADALFQAALPQAEPAGAKVLAFPKRRWAAAAGVTLALAAATLVFVLRGGDALPEYRLAVQAGDQLARGPDAPPPTDVTYSPGSRVLLIARPAVDLAERPVVRVYLAQRGDLRRLDVPVMISDTGAVKVDLVAGESLPAQPGVAALMILIRPPGLDTPDVTLLESRHRAPAQLLRHVFRYQPAPEKK